MKKQFSPEEIARYHQLEKIVKDRLSAMVKVERGLRVVQRMEKKLKWSKTCKN